MSFKKVAVGGSFDPVHNGHIALLEKAFEIGEFVEVGLTSEKMLRKDVAPYAKRKKNLEEILSKFKSRYKIVKLDDPYGGAATDKEFEAIVVSPETAPRANEINALRKKNALTALEIVTVPFVMAEDGLPISSTRIRKGEIDSAGKILKRK